MIHGY
jgi:hypothetical protein